MQENESEQEIVNPICESTIQHTVVTGAFTPEQQALRDKMIVPPLDLQLARIRQLEKMLGDVSLYACALLSLGHGGYVMINPAVIEHLKRDYTVELIVGEHEPTKSVVLQAKLTPKVSKPEEPKIFVPGA